MMPDGLLQLASTIFLTFGLGTLLYALVSYGLRHLVGDPPRDRTQRAPAYPTAPPPPQAYYGPPYGGYAQPGMPHPGMQMPQGYPGYPGYPQAPQPPVYPQQQAPWPPPGPPPQR